MGHLNGKEIYQKLGEKIDNLTVRVPWNESVYDILSELYSPKEADFIIKMPYTMSNLERLKQTTKYEEIELKDLLETLCMKGLVMDFWVNEDFYYMPSPMIVGIFEFTMMRTGDNLNSKGWAKLFHEYMQRDDSIFPANFKNKEKISLLRSLPHEGTIEPANYVEVLDYEKATSLIEDADKFAIGICTCRHEKFHVGEKCDVPLESCTSFGNAADYIVRRNLGKEISKSEMLDVFARSKEMGLVFNADNVKKNIQFVCHCCGCCCNVLQGIKRFGYPNILVTSNYIARIDEDECLGCGKCAKACNVDAIEMHPIENPKAKKKKRPELDTSFCLGCGVCALKCKTGALKLVHREQRVLHPETTFERVILQCLERGTLQNQLFGDPQSISHKFMRGFVGAALKLPPVKKTLMSDMFRSTFLKAMNQGLKMQGNGWISEM